MAIGKPVQVLDGKVKSPDGVMPVSVNGLGPTLVRVRDIVLLVVPTP